MEHIALNLSDYPNVIFQEGNLNMTILIVQ